MSKKLYKYIGPKILELSTSRTGFIGFKCSYPKGYNDPYELFLSIDTSIDTQLLAFYKDSVGEIPQIPTTCFSKSPVVVPMWAHYGHSSQGFVIEVDEDKLEEYFNDISIKDVTYTDIANEAITTSLSRAFVTCKPRHTFFLHKLVMASAYFSKQSCWSYELERRVIIPSKETEDINGNMIFSVPTDCVTAIVAGAKVEGEYWQKAEEISHSIGCKLYKAVVGKSFPEKYLKDLNGVVYIYKNGEIVKTTSICQTCSEPLKKEDSKSKKCSWCAITETHETNAARNNPYRMLEHAGILEEHLRGMEDIYSGKS